MGKNKKDWIDNYRNKDEIAGHSIKSVITPKDEWCAEAFMETDYYRVDNKLFEEEILKYSTFLFFNKKRANVSSEIKRKKSFDLDMRKFKDFFLGDLFKIEKGREQAGNTEFGKIPLISATRDNNGISGYWDEVNKLFSQNLITVVSNGASTGEAFYQGENFVQQEM